MNCYTRRAFLGMAAAGALISATGCGATTNGGASSTPFDQQFIDMVVPHHQAGVEMAKIAQQRSQRAEIETMAQTMMASQASEIERLTAWRKQWFGSEQTPPMARMPMVEGSQMAAGASGGMSGMSGMGGMGGTTMDASADVEKLRSAPEPFDRAFIDALIPHHQTAIDAASAAQTRAQKPEIKQVAAEDIAPQQKEIDQLMAWRKAWFGA